MKELVQLCKEIYNTGVWTKDFLQTITVPLKKKPNAMTCEDHRTISLLEHASKIVLRVLTKRIQFRAERDNCIGKTNMVSEKGHKRCNWSTTRDDGKKSTAWVNIYVCFADYEKVCDRVDRKKLMNALRRIGVDWKDSYGTCTWARK